MMQFSFSLLTVALLTFSSVSPILGRIAVPELWRKERFDAEQDVVNKLAKRNYVCYEDDFLNGLEADPGYFSALCSSYLTETDAISTSDVTSTTTTSVIYTTLGYTDSTTATVPSSTVTIPAVAGLRKRQTAYSTGAISSTILVGATAPQTISSMLSDCQANPTGEKLSILNSYSSACSCFVSPGVDTLLVTLTSTRTISGQDHAEDINTVTVTSGVTTVTVAPIAGPSSGLPTFTNATVSATILSSASLTIPASSQLSASGSPTASTNVTISTSSSSAAPAPSLSGCPAANGTTYVTQGQTFLIICDINFPGPDDQGLAVPSLHQCVDDCALTNLGFSGDACYAASYNPSDQTGDSNCFFESLPNSLQPFPDNFTIGALLIPSLSVGNGTNTTLPNGTYPTGTGIVPSGSVFRTGSSLSRNVSTSAYATISINVTTTPSFSISLTISDNRTFVGPTGTGFMPSNTGIFPSRTGVIPSGSGILPSGTGVLPSGSGVLPSGTGVLPSGSGVIPSGTGVLPSGSGIFPPSDTGLPRTGVSASGTGIFPSGTGIIPSGTGIIPSGTGISPTGTGIIPSGTGVFPSGTGSPNSTWCGSPKTVTITSISISYITIPLSTAYTAQPHSTAVEVFTETISV